ncbi:MAG: stalk domain-containing protein [Pseudoflavonifractor sp.]|nr:stalk domain-containing protein [Pseudoflavonifractor sp.]
MKKGLSLLLTAILVLSTAVTSAAAHGDSGKSSSAPGAKVIVKTTETDSASDASEPTSEKADETPNKKSQKPEAKKEFRVELNTQKKALQQQKNDLNQEKESLQAQYEALLASGDAESAASLLKNIQELDQQIQALQAQMKEIINERFMVAKTLYTDEELAQFSSASDLIAQMYADAEVLQAGSVTVNNQIIKFGAPAYLKNGTILVPLRAIAEKVGGDVTWDSQTQTVKITKGDTVIEITPNSMTALVNGVPVEMDQPANVTCGRSYVPLQFFAETLGLKTDWDSENGTVDIDDGSAEVDSADTSAENGTMDTTAADSTNAETTTTDAAQG